MEYTVIQLTNTNIGAVATDTALPLGEVSRKRACSACNVSSFSIGTTGADYIQLNSKGYYLLAFSISAVAAADGLVSFDLSLNDTTVYTVSSQVAAAGDTVSLSFVFIVRVLPNCAVANNLPVAIKILNSGVALSGGVSNLIVEKKT